ncbi:MAG: N-acetylmuramoyl-L-alanine amidase [Magnetococcales bacterium]|nr:N-acetylmuramoyl-L-alanine amidase [Magnetococcales bacterium]
MSMERRQLLKAMILSAGGMLVPGGLLNAAKPSRIRDIRLWTAPDHTRIVFDLTEPVQHTMFHMQNPERVVLEVPGLQLGVDPSRMALGDVMVREVRTTSTRNGVTQAVIELKREAMPKSFFLGASGKKGPRLVVDLYRKEDVARNQPREKQPQVRQAKVRNEVREPQGRSNGRATREHDEAQETPERDVMRQIVPREEDREVTEQRGSIREAKVQEKSRKTPSPREERVVRRRSSRERILVIDPGHGGEDPGAIGMQGTLEKDLTLSVARLLADKVNSAPGMQACLTRDGDYYVSLSKRVAIARQRRADLFMSLHADAFHMTSARGASVYCLSERGKPTPDRAIRALVKRENSADLIGGVNLGQDFAPEVAEMLMDLSQRDSINRAMQMAQHLLGNLKGVPDLRLHYRSVKQAGFAVLKAPDIPSVLVEMAFLSNPLEEEMMRRSQYQNQLADALFRGTRNFVISSYQA